MDRKKLNWWLTLLANLGVLGGLVFVGFEIRQNTSQLRADASHSITASVNEMNAGIYADSTLADLVLRGEQNLDALNALDLETEGISDLNFRFVDHIVREFRTKPGLQAFIRGHADAYVGSKELLGQLLSR
jgi:hypothetical protein